MLFMLFLFFLAPIFTYAGETDLPPILKFVDDENQIWSIPQEKFAWSKTLTECYNNTELEKPKILPIHNVDRNIFGCLLTLMGCSTNPVTLLDTTRPLERVKKIITDKLAMVEFVSIDCRDLLVQANYLCPHNKVVNSLAKTYVDRLINPQVYRDNNGCVIFDNLPSELELLGAGWLWRDIFKKAKAKPISVPLPKKFTVCDDYDDDSFSHCIATSNVSDVGDVIYVQVNVDGCPKLMLPLKLAKVNFNKKTVHFFDIMQEHDSNNKYALSHDGRYFICDNLCNFKTKKKILFDLYDLNDILDENQPRHTKLKIDYPFKGSEKNMNVDQIIFDKTNRVFHIFMVESEGNGTNICLISIDPVLSKCSLCSCVYPSYLSYHRKWSCDNGAIACLVFPDKPEENNTNYQAFIFKDGSLLECTFDQNEEKWVYKMDDKSYDAGFDVIQPCSGSAYETWWNFQHHSAISHSFVPNIRNVLPRVHSNLFDNLSERPYYDQYHFCITEYRDGNAKIHNIIPFELTKIWHMLNDKVRSGNHRILTDSYLLNLYYTRPDGWQEEIEALKQYASPEIVDITRF